MSEPFQLRDYQLEAIKRTRAAFAAGKRRVVVVGPTGFGKTAVGAAMAAMAFEKGQRSLWLAHRAELVEQAVGAIERTGMRVGTISASARTAPDPSAPMQCATIQTLLARNLTPDAPLIFLDEAHHYPAEVFGAFVARYPRSYVVGFTATPERGDGKGLGGELFDGIVIGARLKQLVAEGYLVHAEIIGPKRKLKGGQICARPVDAYQQYAAGRKAISFTNNVAAAIAHTAEFEAAGIRAGYVTGEMNAKTRVATLDAFRAGDIAVLCNVHVLTEGFDVPATDCCILASGCGTTGNYLQKVGRVLRPAPGKKDALVLDLNGNSHVHGHPEDEYVFSLEGAGIRSSKSDAVGYCQVCGAPLLEVSTACPECGIERESTQPPKVVNSPMEKFAGMRAKSEGEKAEVLARWLEDGARKGHKSGAALHKFKAVFGYWPPAAFVIRARGMIAG